MKRAGALSPPLERPPIPRVAKQAQDEERMMIDTDTAPMRVTHRQVAFDVKAVVRDLHLRGYPNASFVETVLDGRHVFG